MIFSVYYHIIQHSALKKKKEQDAHVQSLMHIKLGNESLYLVFVSVNPVNDLHIVMLNVSKKKMQKRNLYKSLKM